MCQKHALVGATKGFVALPGFCGSGLLRFFFFLKGSKEGRPR